MNRLSSLTGLAILLIALSMSGCRIDSDLTIHSVQDNPGSQQGSSTGGAADSGTSNAALSYEAENASFDSQMTLASNAQASGSKYLVSSVANAGAINFQVDLPESGDYVIWSRVLAPSSSSDSYFVSVDGGSEDIYDVAERSWSNQFQYTEVNGRGASGTPLSINPRVFSLSAGTHVIRFRAREAGAGLDRILLTRDRSYRPDGASIAMPSPTPSASATSTPTPTPSPSSTGTPSPSPTPSQSPAPTSASPTPSPTLPPVAGQSFFVSPTGTAQGDGSQAHPWDIKTAFAAPGQVHPGDTIWLRGGLYDLGGDDVNRPTLINLNGTEAQPIVVRQFPGERATINGNLTIQGSYVWLWGFEVANTNFDADSVTSIGVSSYGTGCKLINLVIHDHPGDGIGLWEQGLNQEAYGNIIYNNGSHGNNGSQTAHGIYSQNEQGTKHLVDNIIFDQSGYGVHVYGVSGSLVGFTIDGNAVVNNGSAGILVGGSTPADAIVVQNNMTYSAGNDTPGIWMGHDQVTQNRTLTVKGNYIGNGFPAIRIYNWNNATITGNLAYSAGGSGSMTDIAGSVSGWSWSGNSWYGDSSVQSWLWALDGSYRGFNFSQWKSATGLGAGESYLGATPPNAVFMKPNAYEPGRANIIVYNWSLKSSVQVDLSGVLTPGTAYEIRDVVDFYGTPVVSGIYGGGTISLPMKSTEGPPSASGTIQPSVMGPTFGAFVVMPKN